MIKEAILIAGGVAVHGARKVVKKTGEKIEEVQKQRFGKVIEQNKQEEKDHEQLWVEEEIVKKGNSWSSGCITNTVSTALMISFCILPEAA